ncbi:MAG: hypothetical protein IJU03_12140, partial [Thermoguttaceae bacterium]|nr:hypothetical protein [Thermoguttaceae bacterium]
MQEQARSLFYEWFIVPEIEETLSRRVKLGTIARIKTRVFSPSKNPDVNVEHYSIPALDEKGFPSFENSSNIKSNKFLLDSSSVIISKLNPQTKRICRPFCLTDNAICSSEFIVY